MSFSEYHTRLSINAYIRLQEMTNPCTIRFVWDADVTLSYGSWLMRICAILSVFLYIKKGVVNCAREFGLFEPLLRVGSNRGLFGRA